MVRILPDENEQRLIWVGSALDDPKRFPDAVQDEIGTALSAAQFGHKVPSAKPWHGEGPSVFEVVEDFRTDTYRAVYTVRFSNAVYVLHTFQKKSRTGRKTDKRDVELIGRRSRDAHVHYEQIGDPHGC
jgi:phage-related protein